MPASSESGPTKKPAPRKSAAAARKPAAAATTAAPAKPRRTRRGGPSQTTPAAAERHERDHQIVKLRLAGAGWQAIADQLGLASPGHAHDRYRAFMKEYPREDAETLRDLEADRLDRLQMSLWARATNPADTQHMWAVDRVLKISDQRTRLLGLNLPPAARPDESGVGERKSALSELFTLMQTQAEAMVAAGLAGTEPQEQGSGSNADAA